MKILLRLRNVHPTFHIAFLLFLRMGTSEISKDQSHQALKAIQTSQTPLQRHQTFWMSTRPHLLLKRISHQPIQRWSKRVCNFFSSGLRPCPELNITAVYPIPWHIPALEAISICFALEVPQVALLVVPSSAPVQRILQVLQGLDVNARGLNLLTRSAGKSFLLRGRDSEPQVEERPSLLVSTLASTRGLDIPELSHVFILGMQAGRVDAYLHVAGRTGRFGMPGKVISVVEGQRDRLMSDGIPVKDEEKKMSVMFKEMGIEPIKVDYFD